MQTASKHLWASTIAAVIGSLCCVAPLVLITLGISGAWIGRLTAMEPYRPIFIGITGVFMALAFRQLYVVPPDVRRATPARIQGCSTDNVRCIGS